MIIFGITGRNSGYTESFFTGRIAGKDREEASVNLEFEIGDRQYQLTRGIFDGPGLRVFKIFHNGQVEFENTKFSISDREMEYRRQLTAAIGLGSFQQFVFLQHFVFTFDEGRHLLLWDQNALNHALHICIGSDFDRANEADALQRQMERAGSLARNKQYQASGVSNRISALRDAIDEGEKYDTEGPTPEEIENAHRVIGENFQRQQEKVVKKLGELRDAELKWANASSQLNALQIEFSQEFSKHVHKKSRVELHPLVAATLSENECSICATHGVAGKVKAKIDEGHCPLCGMDLPALAPDEDSISRLKEIDQRVSKSRKMLETTANDKERVSAEVIAAENRLNALKKQLREYEEANRRVLLEADSGGISKIYETINRLEEELSDLLEQKEAKYKERDKLMRQLVKLQRELERQYELAEDEFVPLFQQLAYAFLGIELLVRAESKESITSLGLSLLLEMKGSVRREIHQTSESQRFFLDIALRMAMAQYVSKPDNEAPLYIDTPEGSLDIAYEARAGLMFAKFVELGHDLIMTANINSSQILRRLARECGKSRMAVQKMTNWTQLTDVQLREDKLFREAYDEIEESLKEGEN